MCIRDRSELVGVGIPDTVQGKSLIPILKNTKAKVRDEAFSVGNGNNGFSIGSKGWTYIWYKDGSEELYDMNKDPKQFINLASNSKHKKTLFYQTENQLSSNHMNNENRKKIAIL